MRISKNSVGTKHLKKNAVTSPKVRNRSLKAVDFATGQLPAGAPVGDTSPTFTQFELLKQFGTFTKQSASSGILIRANITTQATPNDACQFQIRVDGATVSGSTSTDPDVSGAGGSSAIRSNGSATINVVPMAIDADFGALAAGNHTVAVYMRGSDIGADGAVCTEDPINLQQERATVIEYSR